MVRKAIIKEGTIDLLITVAHPHVIHWATSIFINRNKIKLWVADCGDPYMGNPFTKHCKLFGIIEKYWNAKCNYIVVPVTEAINAYYKEYRDKIRVIPQGFDFDSIHKLYYSENKIITFIYAGACYHNLRNPKVFLLYLSSLKIDFRFIVFTKTTDFFSPYKELLGEKLVINGVVPREQLIPQMCTADFLVNFVNDSGVQQPSKLIDYLYTERPVINISSSFSHEEKELFIKYLNKDYSSYKVNIDISKYNIKTVANQFLNIR